VRSNITQMPAKIRLQYLRQSQAPEKWLPIKDDTL
jgi:hypothetical protein